MKFGWDLGHSIFYQQHMAIADWQCSSLQGFLVPERSSIPMNMGHPEHLPNHLHKVNTIYESRNVYFCKSYCIWYSLVPYVIVVLGKISL